MYLLIKYSFPMHNSFWNSERFRNYIISRIYLFIYFCNSELKRKQNILFVVTILFCNFKNGTNVWDFNLSEQIKWHPSNFDRRATTLISFRTKWNICTYKVFYQKILCFNSKFKNILNENISLESMWLWNQSWYVHPCT